jgi:hypothetical protein
MGADSLNRIQPHPRARPRREDAKDEFFEQEPVVAFQHDRFEFGETAANRLPFFEIGFLQFINYRIHSMVKWRMDESVQSMRHNTR